MVALGKHLLYVQSCPPFFSKAAFHFLPFQDLSFDEFCWLYSTALELPLYPSERRKHLSPPSTEAPVYTVGGLQHHREELINCKVKGQLWKLSPSAHHLTNPKIHLFLLGSMRHIQIMLWLETHYVQFYVLIFHHAQGSMSELCLCVRGGGGTLILSNVHLMLFSTSNPQWNILLKSTDWAQ